jgi:nucleotide-binding universal stress UspA family protein
MANRLIVVPLDGSELSEAAVPYAVALAKATKAGLLLVTVWEGAEEILASALPQLADDLFKRGEEHYEQYLAGVAKTVQAQGVQTEAQVIVGHAVEELLKLLRDRDASMLALSTHGRSGMSRWVYGSVAGKLIREAELPTLLIGPRLLEAKAPPAITRILVPLDASELSETALAPAVELAEAFGAGIVLAQVLNWATHAFVFGVPDVDTATIDQELTKASQEYLERMKAGLQTKRPVETKTLRGMAADALIDLVGSEKIGLVVMASHGRAGVVRTALGSVADRMIQGPAPVLLVRPAASEE